MDGYQFEYQCAEILKRNGFSRVQVTQSSGDQGVDIIAHKHRKKYGIQCKYYSYPVGNKAVQEAYAGANFYDCDRAMVMYHGRVRGELSGENLNEHAIMLLATGGELCEKGRLE